MQSPLTQITRFQNIERRFSSWSYTVPGFEKIFHTFCTTPPGMTKSEGLLNESSGKYVWHLCQGGYDFAFKINPGKTPWRYIFSPSLAAREALNYQKFAALGLPTAQLLGVADQRNFFILKKSFIATGFLTGTQDGRLFMPGNPLYTDSVKKAEFTKQNMEHLATAHDARIYHKAFHPRNLLWRDEENNKMQTFWIDVARCRSVSMSAMPRAILVDLHTFFRDMRMTCGEMEQAVTTYLAARKNGTYPGGKEQLIHDLFHFKRRIFSRKKYKITAEQE